MPDKSAAYAKMRSCFNALYLEVEPSIVHDLVKTFEEYVASEPSAPPQDGNAYEKKMSCGHAARYLWASSPMSSSLRCAVCDLLASAPSAYQRAIKDAAPTEEQFKVARSTVDAEFASVVGDKGAFAYGRIVGLVAQQIANRVAIRKLAPSTPEEKKEQSNG